MIKSQLRLINILRIIKDIFFNMQFKHYITKIINSELIIKQMDGIITQTKNKLARLPDFLMVEQIKYIYIIFGNQKAGKNTLVHYMIESSLIFEVDDQGQDVLNIQNEVNKEVIVEDVLELISCEQRASLYIKVIGFMNPNKSQQQQVKWSLSVDFLLKLLENKSAPIKFILIFSLQQIQQDDDIFVKYYNTLKNVPDFVKRSYVVLSKLYDESQYHQFSEMTAQNIKQTKDNCGYIDQLIQQQRILGFYSRDVDENQRNEFNQKLNSYEVPQKLQLIESGTLIRSVLNSSEEQNYLHQQFQKFYTQLSNCLNILNLSIIQIMIKGCKLKNETETSQKFKQFWGKVFGQSIQFQAKDAIAQNKSLYQFFKKYEQLVNLSKSAHQQLLVRLIDGIKVFLKFYPDKLLEKGIYGRILVLILICKALTQKQPSQLLKSQDLINIFINHQNGCFEDHYVLKVFQKAKKYFSAQFNKNYQGLASKPVKKRVKKTKVKNYVAGYQEQRKNYLLKYPNPEQIYNLYYSPLKLDLLIEQLQKTRTGKSRNIILEKKIIKNICRVLEVYECFQEAIKFAWIGPDHFSMLYYLNKYIKTLMINELDITNDSRTFLEELSAYFYSVSRQQNALIIKQQIQRVFESRPQQLKQKNDLNIKKLFEFLQKQKQKSTQTVKDQQKSIIYKCFMKYDRISDIVSKKQSLIQKFINFQDKNYQKVQLKNIVKWVRQEAELKVVTD